MPKQTQPRKTTAPTPKDLDKARMSAQDPKKKAKTTTPDPSKKANSNDFVLVDVWARKVLDWNHDPLKTPDAPSFGSFQAIYSKLWTGLKAQEGGCQAVLIDSTGQLSYARNTSRWSDSEDAGQHSEETLFLQAKAESFKVKGILITIEPCYRADGKQRYPGHECQAFFRGGRKLPSPDGPLRSFDPFVAYTPIFFLESQPLRQQSSTTSRFLKGLPSSEVMEWLAGAAGPAFGTVIKPLGKPGRPADPRSQIIGQEYMEAAAIYTALTGDRYDRNCIKSFSEWNPTTCDDAVKAAVKNLFPPEAASAAASQSPAYNKVVGTAGAVVVGAFAKGYSLTK
jgi:hypothetical protein